MSFRFKEITRFANDSQETIILKLKIRPWELSEKPLVRSKALHFDDICSMHLIFILSHSSDMYLRIESPVLKDVNVCCTVIVFDEEETFLHGEKHCLNLQNERSADVLSNFKPFSSFLSLTILCSLEAHRIYNKVEPVMTVPRVFRFGAETDKKQIQKTDKEVQVGLALGSKTRKPIQKTDKEVQVGLALGSKTKIHIQMMNKQVQVGQGNSNREQILKIDKKVQVGPSHKEAEPAQNIAEKVVTKPYCESIQFDCLNELTANFGKLLDQSIEADITMHIEGISMKVHKLILRARSPVFDKMFNHNTSEAALSEIYIEDVRAPIMKELLNFLYTGTKKNLDFDDACDLYHAADKYEVLSLRNACKKELLQHLQVDNACLLLTLATNHGDESMKADIVKFIQDNFQKIVLTKSFEELAKYDANLVVLLMRGQVTKSEF